MILVIVLAAVIGAALLASLAIAASNALTFPRLRVPPPAAPPLIHPSAQTPLVSVLIPAYNQAPIIAATVRALRAQTYTPFEVVILDGGSHDGTHAIAEAAATGDPRFRLIAGQPLLATWRSANWAAHQLAQVANGRVLVFADAHVQWQPDALRALVARLHASQADLLTVWPTSIAVSRAERLVVPLIAQALLGSLPASLIERTRTPALVAASDQCLVFRRSAYQAVGGHIAVRGDQHAGSAFARRLKAKGLHLRLADGAGLIACRTYAGWREVRAGFAGDLLALFGSAPPTRWLTAALFLLLFGLPWLWLLFGWLTPDFSGWPLLPLALALLSLAVRALTAWTTRQPVSEALLLPVALALAAVSLGSALGTREAGAPS